VPENQLTFFVAPPAKTGDAKMADAKLAELQEKKNTAATAIQELGNRQDKWTAEDRGQWDTLNKEYDATAAALTARREELTNSEAIQKRLKEIEDRQKEVTGDKPIGLDEGRRREADPVFIAAKSERDAALRFQAWAMTQRGMDIREEHREACKSAGFNPATKELEISTSRQYGNPGWTCGGVPMQREVRVGLDVATSGAGKETIPAGFMAELEKKTLAYGHVRQVCRVIQTPTGNSMPWPVVDDTSNVAAILAEATTISTSVDPTFSAITFLAYKLSSKPVFVSSEIVQDSAFNLATEIGGLIGERFGRGENVYFTTGTNSSQPQGVVNCSGTGVTSAAATAFTADELLALIHSLDPSYRALPSTGFMMHDSVLLYVRKFKDANGQYLWQPGMQAGVADRLAGYPVAINQQMTGTTSSLPVSATKHVLFAAFEKYVIRDIGGVRMYHLTERYRDVDQDCFVAFKRLDARALNTSAVKALLQS
jgi:HK97 family phage major capsid protein